MEKAVYFHYKPGQSQIDSDWSDCCISARKNNPPDCGVKGFQALSATERYLGNLTRLFDVQPLSRNYRSAWKSRGKPPLIEMKFPTLCVCVLEVAGWVDVEY